MPRTPGEWQEAVDTAKFLLQLESAAQYALIAGPLPVIDVDRCEYMLAEGRKIGHTPAPLKELVTRFLKKAAI